MTVAADQPRTAPSRFRWIVLGLVAFASASAYLTRYCISAANTAMPSESPTTPRSANDQPMKRIVSRRWNRP